MLFSPVILTLDSSTYTNDHDIAEIFFKVGFMKTHNKYQIKEALKGLILYSFFFLVWVGFSFIVNRIGG
jgi:hypothetical protein